MPNVTGITYTNNYYVVESTGGNAISGISSTIEKGKIESFADVTNLKKKLETSSIYDVAGDYPVHK